KIGWSFFPRLGVEAGGLELSNAPGFGKEPFAKIDAAGVHVQFLPLLSGKLTVDTVFLHGLNLNLAKNAAGRNNWEDMLARGAKPAPAETGKPAPGKLPIEALSIGRLDIKRANITWRDDAAASLLAVRNLELATGRFVSGEPLDLRLGFELARDKATPIKAALQGRLTASPDALKLAKLDLKVDDSRLTGSMEIHNFASPALRFDLALDKIDLDRYLAAEKPAGKPAAGAKNAPAPVAGSTKSAPAPAAARDGGGRATPGAVAEQPVELPLSTLRSLDVKGKFRIQEMKALGLRSNDAHIQLNAKNGLIAFGPNQAKLYGGNYRGETVLDVRGKTPQVKMDERLEQVQIGPLLKDMQLFDHYTGTGNIGLKLTAQGFDTNQIKKSLNGTVALAFRDGKIEGVDLIKIIEQARALRDAARGKPVAVKASASDATVFKSLTANVRVVNGVAQNDDLVLDGANLRATGRGTADLARETLDYRLKVTVAEGAERRGTTVPVIIAGTFANPSFNVDFGELLKKEAEKQIEKKLQKGLEQLLQPKKRK
ncbi:MAG TPA: AsmA family protein, partial [Acidiferrobacterales bacterium]|nr:AsmA family protein [Acidiferrobacterales bacterium]